MIHSALASQMLDNDSTDMYRCVTCTASARYLSGDDNRLMEGLPVAVYPLHILFQAFAVVEHLPPLLEVIDQPSTTVAFLIAAVLVAAGGSCAAVCLGCPSFVF